MSAILVPSIAVKDDLEKAVMASVREDPDRFKWYRVGSFSNWLPNVPDNDWDPIHRTVILDGEILGYMWAGTHHERRIIESVGVVSLRPGSPTVLRCLSRFLDGLRMNFIGIRYSVVIGNPAQRIWERYAEKNGGGKIGVFPFDARLLDGSLAHQAYYWVPGKQLESVQYLDLIEDYMKSLEER